MLFSQGSGDPRLRGGKKNMWDEFVLEDVRMIVTPLIRDSDF